MRPTEAEAVLRAAREEHRTVLPFTDDSDPVLDEHWGYAVQALDRARRVESGQILVGAKLGLTSKAKQQRMNVDEPIVGFLTDTMRAEPETLAARTESWVQPRIEPEIAFITARSISTPLTLAEAGRAVDAVTVAAEILDSRFDDYRFRLPDVVADNTSAAGFLLGSPTQMPDIGDLASVRCTLSVDDRVAHEATGAAILGHPLKALVLLSDHLARHGQTLPAGSIVLAGALTDAVPVLAGRRYTVLTDALGTLSASP